MDIVNDNFYVEICDEDTDVIKRRKIISKINDSSNIIAINSNRGVANVVIMGKDFYQFSDGVFQKIILDNTLDNKIIVKRIDIDKEDISIEVNVKYIKK